MFSENALKTYSRSNDFNYASVKASDDNFIDRLWQWLIAHLFGRMASAFSSHTGRYVIIGICTLVLFYIVFKWFRLDKTGLFEKRSEKTESLFYQDGSEKPFENLDDGIQQALLNENYAFAIRLWYQKILKALHEAHLIEFKADKTNDQYVSEIKDPHLSASFARLTYFFNHVYYGLFLVEKAYYEAIASRFKQFVKEIHP